MNVDSKVSKTTLDSLEKLITNHKTKSLRYNSLSCNVGVVC